MENNLPDNNLMQLTGKVNPLRAVPYALQQIFSMFVTNLVPILTIAAICNLSDEMVMVLTQNAMVISGIATLIQCTPIWKFGSGLPLYMGSSFTFMMVLKSIGAKYGFNSVVGTVIVGGFLEGILGLTAKYWKKMIEPIVSATVVTGIGLSLLSTATRSFGGGYAEDFGALYNLAAGTATILTCVLWDIFIKGRYKQLSILAGLFVGYIVSLLLGIVVFPDFSMVKIFSLPRVLPVRPEFRFDAILSIFIIHIVSATETMGDVSALTSGTLRRDATSEEFTGALTVDGFGSMLGGIMGVPPVTTYSENVGVTIMTKVVNRTVARVGAIILIICGMFPPIGYFVRTIPNPVIGGVLLVVIGQIVVSGFQMVAEAGFSTRNKLIASLSLAIGVGFTTSSEAGIWKDMPPLVESIFSQNVVAVIFTISFLLNLILPKDME
ncbi:MAG: purine/pyrimidine permease [Spirochaetales bacterium]|nr:purine/pyrimidine permease [Spirochaetales bacterium]